MRYAQARLTKLREVTTPSAYLQTIHHRRKRRGESEGDIKERYVG